MTGNKAYFYFSSMKSCTVLVVYAGAWRERSESATVDIYPRGPYDPQQRHQGTLPLSAEVGIEVFRSKPVGGDESGIIVRFGSSFVHHDMWRQEMKIPFIIRSIKFMINLKHPSHLTLLQRTRSFNIRSISQFHALQPSYVAIHHTGTRRAVRFPYKRSSGPMNVN